MKRLVRSAAGAALCAVLAGCGGAEEAGNATSANEVARQLSALRVEPGLWEQTTEVVGISGPGMPREVASRMAGRRTGRRYCITPEQASRPNATFLATQQNSNCSYRDFTMQGGRITGTMTCTGGRVAGEIRTAMDGQYAPRSYDMRMRMATQMETGEEVTTDVRVVGRKVGECAQEGEG